MNESQLVDIQQEAEAFFQPDTILYFLEHIKKWIQEDGRAYFQVTQEGDEPLLVVAALQKAILVNLVLYSDRISASHLPVRSISLADYVETVDADILRVYFGDVGRPGKQFQYTAYGEKERRRLFVFCKALTGTIQRVEGQ